MAAQDEGRQLMDMVDRALLFGASFDWITPMLTLLKTGPLGSHVQFHIMREHTAYARDVLRAKGIHMEDGAVAPDPNIVMFTVRKRQTRFALYLLQRAGVSVLNADHVIQHAPATRKRKAKAARPRRRTKNVFAS